MWCRISIPWYRRLVKLTLEELRLIEDHISQLDQQMAALLSPYHNAVHRGAVVPGWASPRAADHRGSRRHRRHLSFSQASRLVDGRMPGHRGERGQELQSPLPQGHRQMRRVLNQAANSPVNAKARLRDRVSATRPRLGHGQRSARSPSDCVVRSGRFFTKACGMTHASRGQRRREEGAGAQDDPRAANARLQRRTSPGSVEQPSLIGRDFDPWSIQKRRKLLSFHH